MTLDERAQGASLRFYRVVYATTFTGATICAIIGG